MFEINISHSRFLLHCNLRLMHSPGFDRHRHLCHCPNTHKVDILPSICFLLHRFKQRFCCIITIYDTTTHSGGKAGLLLVEIPCLSLIFLAYLAITLSITGERFGWQKNDRFYHVLSSLTIENRSKLAAPSGIVVNIIFNRSRLIVISVITHPNISNIPTGRDKGVIAR